MYVSILDDFMNHGSSIVGSLTVFNVIVDRQCLSSKSLENRKRYFQII